MKLYTKQILITGCAYSGMIAVGYHAVWPIYGVQKLRDEKWTYLSPGEINFFTSIMYLGNIIATFICGFLCNRIGRKPCVLLSGIVLSVCSIAFLFANNIYWLSIIRVGSGFGFAMGLQCNILYIGEIGSTEIRGILLGGLGLSLHLGFLLLYVIGPFVSYNVFCYIHIFICVVYAVGIIFVPESPLYLIAKGNDDQAKEVLLSLGRKEDAENISELKTELDKEKETMGLLQLFKTKSNRTALTVTCFLYFFQSFSGIAPLLVYSNMLFELSGSSIKPTMATIIVGVIQVVSGLVAPLFVDRNGRRILLLWSTSISFLCLLGLAVYLNLHHIGFAINDNVRWLPLAFLMIFCIVYSSGIGVIPYVLVGEMFDLNARSAGSTAALFINWICSLAVLVIFNLFVFSGNVYIAYYLFSIFCALAFVFTMYFIPETKGKSLIEIQKMLNK